jgi:DNA helicase HerA-like ATPase
MFHGHTTVIGKTRSGKTYATVRLLAKEKQGVLFFNTQYEDVPGYIYADGNNTYRQIKQALKQGKKINYHPGTYLEQKQSELSYLIEYLFQAGFRQDNNIFLAVDEAHLYNDKEVASQLRRVATGGIRFGLSGVWISQRPALVDNTLMTQSTNMLIFECAMEGQYFRRYNVPYDEQIQPILTKYGQYSFVEYDFKNIIPHTRV